MASARVPRRYYHDEWEMRRPRGSNPRDPPRGGPERPADDPRRNPQGRLCGGPARSAKEPQTPSQANHGKTNGGRGRREAKDQRPTIVTVDKNGRERRWGPLSRSNAWRVGCFWDDMKGKVDVFLEKDRKRKKVQIELRVQGRRRWFWFVEETPKPPRQKPEEKEDEHLIVEEDEGSATEDDPASEEQATGMSEVDAEERETERKMWLSEKVTSLENENGELKKTLQEMATRLATKENTTRQVEERCTRLETSISQIVEQLQRQNVFNEGVRASFTSLAEDVNQHKDNFREVARIFQAHEDNIVKTGAASQDMAQYINALIEENENKTVWISSLMRESHEQTQVLRQH